MRKWGKLKALVLALTFLLAATIGPVQALVFLGIGGWSTGSHAVPAQFGINMGTEPRGLDKHDVYDSPAYVSNSGWTGGSYHMAGIDGWDGSTGFYYDDVRANMQPGEIKIWLLYIWAVPTAAPSDLSVTWLDRYNPLILTQLECVQKPTGVAGGPSVGTVWTSPPSMTLPFHATSNGLTGYGFKFTLTMVPEPSSLLALLVGLGGFGTLLTRRRG